MSDRLMADLQEVAPVKQNEPMSRHTTFGVGGTADLYVKATTEAQLHGAYSAAKQHSAPLFIFGSGSNVLVGDGGFRGVVIENRYADVDGPSPNGTGHKVRVGSGMSFATLARRLSGAGFAGIEWACGIPGSLGGAVVTNAGAYGRSLKDVLVSARIADTAGAVNEMTPAELKLDYRRSAFTDDSVRDAIVLSVDLRVYEGDKSELKAAIREFDAHRRNAQPPGRNCGSVFKNPDDKPAWQYVDEVGLRGHRIGNAQFSELHSNFIQNLGGASSDDVASLIRLAQGRIRDRFGVDLVTEVAFVGDFGDGGAG
jgi:UDP-N-acetylmuramate dehydrogenase